MFALLLGAALYLYAATASLFESYQPGMSDFRSRFSPYMIILIVVGVPLSATYVPQLRLAASQLARAFARVALATAAAVLLGLMALEWVEPCVAASPTSRELRSTLAQSLPCPKLSNRSYFAPFYAGASGLYAQGREGFNAPSDWVISD